MDLIIEQVSRTLVERKVWGFSPKTAWKIVKRAMGKEYYPRFFRLNRATRFLDDPSTTIPQMKAWFNWKKTKTISDYVGYSRRHIKEMRAKLSQELE